MKTSKKIVVVDDDPFWTAMLTQILSDLGFTNITTFDDGTTYVNSEQTSSDLVFLDYQMEGMDGLEVLQEIKRYNPSTGVVFCTSYEDLSVAVNAIQYGSYDYLLKGNATKKEVFSIVSNIAN